MENENDVSIVWKQLEHMILALEDPILRNIKHGFHLLFPLSVQFCFVIDDHTSWAVLSWESPYKRGRNASYYTNAS